MTGRPSPGAGVDWWAMLTDPAYLRDPHADLKRLRAGGPVQVDDATGIVFVLGHAEFRQMATAPEMGRDTRLWRHGWNAPDSRARDPLSFDLFSAFQRQMVNANPPDHRRMRDVFEKAFRPSQMERLVPMIEAECRGLVAALPAQTPVDAMSALADHLPLRVARNLFGIPPEMDGQLAAWHAALIRIGDIMMSPDQKRGALEALRQYKDYLRGHLADGRLSPADGLIDLTRRAIAEGAIDEDEALTNLLGLVSGNETTVTLLGNGLLCLLRHPEQLAALRADPALLRPAIEEMLRYEPGIHFILRVAIEDYRCGSLVVPAGSLAIGLVAAINRDPARFDDPDRFDIARQPNAQSIFGGGPHVCIGAALARLQARTAFTALLDRFSTIDLADEPAWWVDRTNQRGLQTLPIRLGSAPQRQKPGAPLSA